MKRINLKKTALLIFVVLLLTELLARFVFGLGQLPLYISDPDFEYIYAPGQNICRFGNRIQTNEFSMRSGSLSEKDSIRILKIGDSVINGGAHIDQDSLSSTLLEHRLSEEFHFPVRVLNISAQSWGPDNAFAYLKKYGDFEADMIVLVFSSHDLHDNMHHQPVVGQKLAWPNEQPLLAITDAWSRYIWPAVKTKLGYSSNEYDYFIGFDDSKINPGWGSFIRYCKEQQIPLLVYLHAEQEELVLGEYTNYGKEIMQMLSEDSIPCIRGMDYIKETSDYRDNIHLNEKGHRELSDALFPIIRDSLLRF